MGFQGDDKIPIFCAFLMDESVIEITGEDSFRIASEYLQELAQFGKYIAFIPLGEMLQKLEAYNDTHPDVAFLTGKVSYVDIMKAYTPESDDEDEMGQYGAFFNKDISYSNQNEWRIVALGRKGNSLIGQGADHWMLHLEAFQYALGMQMEDLLNGEFHVTPSDED